MLDISILNVDKAKDKLLSLIQIPVTITEKTDGTKLTIVRTKQPFSADWKKNWIVSYKGSIIYPEDFEGIAQELEQDVKERSIGISQYKYVFDVLKHAQNNPETKKIPESTELFLEFIMRKPTLTREYVKYHDIVLLAVSSSNYTVSNGRLFTAPKEFDIKNRDLVAAALSITTPTVLFKGTLHELTSSADPIKIITALKDRFLVIPSTYGGIMEGVVLEFENGQFLKVLQDDQHSKELRQKIKQKHAPKDSESYYTSIKMLAREIVADIKETGLNNQLRALSFLVFGNKYDQLFKKLDPKKTRINAKDDVFLTAKTMLIRRLPGNNNALFLGRMSPLTKAHYGIIDNALSQYDGVVVNLVKTKTDKNNPFPLEVQIQMLNRCFGNRIEITTSQTGNILSIIPKTHKVITTVLAGTDRIDSYKKQLLKNDEITVIEIPRTNDISGSKVREALRASDFELFKQNTPKQIWDMFELLKSYIK